jgi:hypothetical protein
LNKTNYNFINTLLVISVVIFLKIGLDFFLSADDNIKILIIFVLIILVIILVILFVPIIRRLVFGLAAIASFFAMIASIIHFQIMAAVFFFILTRILYLFV